MKHIGAVSILTTMLLGLLAWGGTNIVSHGERIKANEVNLKSDRAILIYIRDKVDKINEKL